MYHKLALSVLLLKDMGELAARDDSMVSHTKCVMSTTTHRDVEGFTAEGTFFTPASEREHTLQT